jgi:adenylate cyclase
VLIFNDESERALGCLEKARRLNPLDPRGYITLNAMGAAHFLEGRFQEAEQIMRRALEMNASHPISLRYLTAALAQMGRLDEATEVGRLFQSARLEAMRAHLRRTSFRNREKRQLLFEGLRLAGLPI